MDLARTLHWLIYVQATGACRENQEVAGKADHSFSCGSSWKGLLVWRFPLLSHSLYGCPQDLVWAHLSVCTAPDANRHLSHFIYGLSNDKLHDNTIVEVTHTDSNHLVIQYNTDLQGGRLHNAYAEISILPISFCTLNIFCLYESWSFKVRFPLLGLNPKWLIFVMPEQNHSATFELCNIERQGIDNIAINSWIKTHW